MSENRDSSHSVSSLLMIARVPSEVDIKSCMCVHFLRTLFIKGSITSTLSQKWHGVGKLGFTSLYPDLSLLMLNAHLSMSLFSSLRKHLQTWSDRSMLLKEATWKTLRCMAILSVAGIGI